jgi:hypothetical protein
MGNIGDTIPVIFGNQYGVPGFSVLRNLPGLQEKELGKLLTLIGQKDKLPGEVGNK